mgnify:CR=1 FL=1
MVTTVHVKPAPREDVARRLDLSLVPLPVVEGDGMDGVELLACLEQAGGRVLPARQHDEGGGALEEKGHDLLQLFLNDLIIVYF